MNVIKKIAAHYKKLGTKDKIMSAAAAVLTLAVMIAAPTVAWFTHQRRVLTMAKINSPSKISIRSGAGEDITSYNIQLAHTTNIDFTYTLYKAAKTDDDTKVVYEKEDRDVVYYEKVGEALEVNMINEDTYYGRTVGSSAYVDPSYKNTDERQKFAEPLYWQTKNAVNAAENDDDTTDSVKRNYFILEVSWNDSVNNDKETDLIYLTAQVA